MCFMLVFFDWSLVIQIKIQQSSKAHKINIQIKYENIEETS